MKKLLIILFSSLLLSTACAEKNTSEETKSTPSTSAESTPSKLAESAPSTDEKKQDELSVVITKAGFSFDEIDESVRMAIADGGMIVSGTLHVSEMLNRTGKDIGFDNDIFKRSEAVEFCSALISHKMAAVHPANITMCPFTIAIYELNAEPDVIYLAYRRVKLLGDGKKVEDDIITLLQGIVDESVE
jgi:uncharacterized protein (DUF302 family)